MKSTVIALIIAAVFFLSASISKPTDHDIYQACAQHELADRPQLAKFLAWTGLAQSAYRIEDNFFFKSVYNNITGDRIATAFFGTVIFLK